MAANDFVQNLLGIVQMITQRRAQEAQQETQNRNSQVGALQVLGQLLPGMSDPAQADELLQSFAGILPAFGIDALRNLSRTTAPSTEAVRGGAAAAGRRAQAPATRQSQDAEAASALTTGMNLGEAGTSSFLANAFKDILASGPEVSGMLGNAAALRLLTGQTPGQFSLDQSLHQLDPAELTSAARMGVGLEPTAQQMIGNQLQQQSIGVAAQGNQLQYQASVMGNQLGWAKLAQDGELGHLQLAQDQMLRRLQLEGPSVLTPSQAADIQAAMGVMTERLKEANNDFEKQILMSLLSGQSDILRASGFVMPVIDPTGRGREASPMSGPRPPITVGPPTPVQAPFTNPFSYPWMPGGGSR